MFTLPTKFFGEWPSALPATLPAALPTALSTTFSAAFPAAVTTAFSAAFPAVFHAAHPATYPADMPAALPAELVNAGRVFAETQLAGCNAVMQAAFESGASLVELNVHATREGMAAASTVSNGLLFVREPRDLVCLTASQSQQALERAQRYGRQVAGVANSAQHRLGELSRNLAGSLSRNAIE